MALPVMVSSWIESGGEGSTVLWSGETPVVFGVLDGTVVLVRVEC